MAQIILICTVHEEHGAASISALHSILEQVRPDVIFLEIPPADFPDFDLGARSNLESTAARRYRERRDVTLIPVDMPAPDESLFRDFAYLERRVSATSPAYLQLVDENSGAVSSCGFPYLNSDECSTAWSEIYRSMRDGIQRLRQDSRLHDIFDRWRLTHALRERSMLSSIEAHCLRRPIKTGVFLVGAAHRQSILEARDGLGTVQLSPIVLRTVDPE